MHDHDDANPNGLKRVPWNKGKAAASPKTRRVNQDEAADRGTDTRLGNVQFGDRKLRGCDLVALKVEDVAPSGYAVDRATVRQQKTGQPVRLELTEQTRQAVDDYLRSAVERSGEFIFTGRRGLERNITTRQYARLVSEWIATIGLDGIGKLTVNRRVHVLK
jgi:hypothetical protein